jgi:hypothetical protein
VTQVNLRVCRLLVIVMSSALATTACGDRSYAAMEARLVFERATPPGSSSCWPGESRRLSDAFEASCQMSRSGEWDEYKRWLRGAMTNYEERGETPESITFSRTTEGDIYTVRAEFVTDTTTKYVRIVFRAAPW